jgi:hypothetical protein
MSESKSSLRTMGFCSALGLGLFLAILDISRAFFLPLSSTVGFPLTFLLTGFLTAFVLSIAMSGRSISGLTEGLGEGKGHGKARVARP